MPDWYNYSDHVTRASGIVTVQARCSFAEALKLMGAHAQVTHKSLDEIATAVVERQITFG